MEDEGRGMREMRVGKGCWRCHHDLQCVEGAVVFVEVVPTAAAGVGWV